LIYLDLLQTGRCGDPISDEARFSVSIQTGFEAQPPSYIMDTGAFLLGTKRPELGVGFPLLELKLRMG
jgi:hypothetical protein